MNVSSCTDTDDTDIEVDSELNINSRGGALEVSSRRDALDVSSRGHALNMYSYDKLTSLQGDSASISRAFSKVGLSMEGINF